MDLDDYIFQAVFLAKSSKHGTMHIEFSQLGMGVKEVYKINLWKWQKGIKIPSEFHLHIEMLHLTCQLKHFAYCIPTPLDPSDGQEFKSHKFPKIHHVNSP